MRIGLTYNLKSDHLAASEQGAASGEQRSDRFEEFDSEETIDALEAAIRQAGHQVVRLGWGPAMLTRLRAQPLDGVFNFAEGIGGRGRESQVPAVLEMLGVPCSGSAALTIGMTLDKGLAKAVARAAGIPTAEFFVVTEPLTRRYAPPSPGGRGKCSQSPLPPGDGDRRPGEGRHSLRYPLFAKPAAEGSSMGITATSICNSEEELEREIARLRPYGPILVEEYLPGDEYTAGIVDGEVIGVMQVVPRSEEKDFIYSLEVKRDYKNRVEYRVGRAVDHPEVARLALAVWHAFGLRDVARIDFRCDAADVPNFVEVNPLPGLHPVDSDLVILARGLGWTHPQLVGRIVGAATARWSQP